MRRETAVPRRPKRSALKVTAAVVACLAGGLVGPSVTAAARAAPYPARAAASQEAPARAAAHRVPGTPANVDAASPAEDITPAGLRAYGQSNVSIAASGRYVVEAWNDTTALFTTCPSPKAQVTGLGFSSDGGKTFTDLTGLPDARCSQDNYQGYPSVVAYRAGGHTYFYISSMFGNYFG